MKCCVPGGLNKSFVEMLPEVPLLVIHTHGGHVIGSEGDFSVPANVDDTTFAGDNLVEALAITEGDGNDLIPRAGFALVPQMIDPFAGNWHQALHCCTSKIGSGE